MFQSRCLQNIKTNCNLLKNDPVKSSFEFFNFKDRIFYLFILVIDHLKESLFYYMLRVPIGLNWYDHSSYKVKIDSDKITEI